MKHRWIWTVGATVLACSASALAPQDSGPQDTGPQDTHQVSDREATQQGSAPWDDDEPVRDGAWLYHRNCAGCHNDNGDGRGETILSLGLTARDFQQGGFAFGDSREQMKRTLLSGIPGRSPMPSFKGVLDDGQLELVIDHVRTLMPPRDERPPQNTEVLVRDRAAIARGKLPPISDGAGEIPRGLLIGTPAGLTFEYDLGDVHLRCVRFGRFAEREDWSDRGGGYLRPLGQVVWTEPDPSSRFTALTARDAGAPATSQFRRLRSTRVSAASGSVTFDVLDRPGAREVLATVEEMVATRVIGVGPAIERVRHVRFAAGTRAVRVDVGGRRSSPWRPGGGSLADGRTWWVADLGAEGVEAVLVAPQRGVAVVRAEPAPAPLDVELRSETSEPARLCTFTVRVPAWSPELAHQLAEELLP